MKKWDGNFGFGAVDEHGKPVQRSKSEYPYSYDGFVTWRGGKNEDANSCVYSDRMLQWDCDKYNRCAKQVWNDERQIFFNTPSHQIEKFLQLYFEDEALKLILIMEYCNVSSGYPLWRFDFKTTKK